MIEKWQIIAKQKQEERLSRIPKAWLLHDPPPATLLDVRDIPNTCGILTAAELELTASHDATALLARLHAGSLTSLALTTALCKRAAVAQQLSNCLTEILFDSALARAAALDAAFARTGRPVGPLHGLPVSLKDTFRVRGVDACIGIAGLARRPSADNSPLVDVLLAAGAVPYCKTNVPQGLAALDSANNVFGRTRNPANARVTAGGSSGGEGALAALRGSLLGVGTDVGGSVRVPAMCNGVVGVKPSHGRVPFAGQETGGLPGSERVGTQASAGCLARSVRDCELFLSVVARARPWERDPQVAYGTWEEQGKLSSERGLAKRPLIGILRHDGLVEPLPPIARIMEETVEALRRFPGCDVVEVPVLPELKRLPRLVTKLFGPDGGKRMLELLSATGTMEPLIPWLAMREGRMSDGKPLPLLDVQEAQGLRTELETALLKLWSDERTGRVIDAIVTPVAPHPTLPIDQWNYVDYTSTWVLADCPAGTLPVREFVESDMVGEIEGSEPWNNFDRVNRGFCDRTTTSGT